MAAKISTDQELEVLLESLGTTSAQVADFLVEAGVKGTPECDERCPVANWLGRETGLWPRVDYEFVRLYGAEDEDEERELIAVPAPNGISSFVVDFDAGAYPDLEDD